MSNYDFDNVNKGSGSLWLKFPVIDVNESCIGFMGDFEADVGIDQESVKVGTPLRLVGKLPNEKKAAGKFTALEMSPRNYAAFMGMSATDIEENATVSAADMVALVGSKIPLGSSWIKQTPEMSFKQVNPNTLLITLWHFWAIELGLASPIKYTDAGKIQMDVNWEALAKEDDHSDMPFGWLLLNGTAA